MVAVHFHRNSEVTVNKLTPGFLNMQMQRYREPDYVSIQTIDRRDEQSYSVPHYR
jgi:hypothetical protein